MSCSLTVLCLMAVCALLAPSFAVGEVTLTSHPDYVQANVDYLKAIDPTNFTVPTEVTIYHNHNSGEYHYRLGATDERYGSAWGRYSNQSFENGWDFLQIDTRAGGLFTQFEHTSAGCKFGLLVTVCPVMCGMVCHA